MLGPNFFISKAFELGRLAGVAVLVWGWAFVLPAAEQSLTLERQLLAHAPEMLKQLRDRNCTRIGVLKFRVERPGSKVSDQAGTLNMFVAERLEAALALANPHSTPDRIDLVRNASQAANAIPGASHLSPAGRKKLFSHAYPPAWGTAPISVDAFITGVVRFAADYKSFDLNVLVVRPVEPFLDMLQPPIKVATNGAILHESGASFQVRSVGGRPEMAEIAESARQVRENPEEHFPFVNNPSVVLRIYYDGQPVNLTMREGEAWVPEPLEGQKVSFELERLDQADMALGVVLKVNGENTLFRQRLRDLDCAKWVLTRQQLKGTIRGFQIANQPQAEEFRVASVAESKRLEMNYGVDVGTISVVVFAEATAAPPQNPIAGADLDEEPDLAVIAKAQFPTVPPRNSEALKAQLRSLAGGERTRGLIVQGRNISQAIELESYVWQPEPIISAVIRYYHPAK